MYYELSEYLNERKIKFSRRYQLSQLSSIRIGGYADYYISPTSASEFISIIDFLANRDIPRCVFGGATNTLFAFDSFAGAALSSIGMRGLYNVGDVFIAQCGVSLAALMSYAARLGYGGSEELWLIPGSVGGAVRGNAGAHGREISDILEYADVYFPKSRELRRIGREELGFSYRGSLIKSHKDAYVVSAAIRLEKSDYGKITERRRFFLEKRRSSQPTKLPSLGSIFKRIDGVGAGYYIDRAGLKGVQIGGAKISEEHAGFIVNAGGATHKDVLELISIIVKTVYAKFGIMPEKEIEIIGKEV